MDDSRPQEGNGLLSLRAAVILALATIIAVAAGILTYLVEDSLPAAVLCGGATWGGSVALLAQLISR